MKEGKFVRKEYRINVIKSLSYFLICFICIIFMLLMIIFLFKSQPLSGINTPIYAGAFFALFAMFWGVYQFINYVIIIDDDSIVMKMGKNVKKVFWSDVSQIKYKKRVRILYNSGVYIHSYNGDKLSIIRLLSNYNEILKIINQEVTSNNPQAQIDDSFKTILEKIS